MSKNKTSETKEYLSREVNKNERAPVWVYLKTKSRDLIQGRKRGWRSGNLGKIIKRKKRKSAKYVKSIKQLKKPKTKKKPWSCQIRSSIPLPTLRLEKFFC